MIDSLDQKLILELQHNGRQMFVGLAKKLGTTEGTVRNRVKRLLQKGIIDIVAVPNMAQLGYGLVSFMGLQVRMTRLEKVVSDLTKCRNLCYLALVAGQYDMMAIVVTRSQEELSQVIKKEISTIAGVLKTETFVNMEIAKGGIPLLDTLGLIRSLHVSPLRKAN